jgi:hypothetical protein
MAFNLPNAVQAIYRPSVRARIGEVASQRETNRWKASLEGSGQDPQLHYRYRCTDTAARITDGACGHRPRCFLATSSGSQNAARASSQKRKLVVPSIEEQCHQSRDQSHDLVRPGHRAQSQYWDCRLGRKETRLRGKISDYRESEHGLAICARLSR